MNNPAFSRVSGRLLLFPGIVPFVSMPASLPSLSRALQNPTRFDQFYCGLLIFNTLGLLTLVMLIGLNIRGLIRRMGLFTKLGNFTGRQIETIK